MSKRPALHVAFAFALCGTEPRGLLSHPCPGVSPPPQRHKHGVWSPPHPPPQPPQGGQACIRDRVEGGSPSSTLSSSSPPPTSGTPDTPLSPFHTFSWPLRSSGSIPGPLTRPPSTPSFRPSLGA